MVDWIDCQVNNNRKIYYYTCTSCGVVYTHMRNESGSVCPHCLHLKSKKEYYQLHKYQWENYAATHQERRSEIVRTWQVVNRDRYLDIHRVNENTRRARAVNNGGSFTTNEWLELCAKYNNRCVCCGEDKPLTIDHVIPICKGGTSDINNIQPLCALCNIKKHAKSIDYRISCGVTI